MEMDTLPSVVCSNCCKTLNTSTTSDISSSLVTEKCRQWLEGCNLSDDLSDSEGLSCFSSTDSDLIIDGAMKNDEDNDNGVIASKNVVMEDRIVGGSDKSLIWKSKEPNHYENIRIYKAKNIHIGNITHIHGPVHINEFSPKITQNILVNTSRSFPIVSRRTWLAQPPLDPTDIKYFSGPAKFVIICHSATEESDKQTGNNLLVRLIQQFHVESLHWNDIGYNFLVGADGSVYEGRGWKVIGAHTMGYNTHSIGICFIGCYMRRLPPTAVMKMARDLIKYGVETGAISPDYSLLGHCQCRSSESPGARLFEEIKTWERWDGSVSVDNPSPWAVY